MLKILLRVALLACIAMLVMPAKAESATTYIAWEKVGLAIPAPLGGLRGDARRGKALIVARDRGNCLACHRLPIPEEPFHGTLGPSLVGVARRLSVDELRLRVVDEKQLNPLTIMPGYYRAPNLFNQVAPAFEGKTLLTAQEVEDVVAYLATLRQDAE